MDCARSSIDLLLCAALTAWAQDAASADAAPAAAALPAAEGVPAADAAPAASAAVSSSSAERGKFFLGLRLGYGLPMGNSVKDVELSDSISGMIPIWLDVGYMVTRNIMVGVYGQLGIASVKDCPDGADCPGSGMRFGLQGQYHIMPTEKINPWVGLGIGYEITSYGWKAGATEMSSSFKGMEYLNLQGGADFKLTPGIGIGPFLSFSLGQYGNLSSKVSGLAPAIPDQDTSDDIPSDQTAMHEWFTVGMRGAFNL